MEAVESLSLKKSQCVLADFYGISRSGFFDVNWQRVEMSLVFGCTVPETLLGTIQQLALGR